MKRFILIVFTSLLAVTLSAETSAIKLQMFAERLWRQGEYQEAMDSATRALSVMPNNSAAKNFIHDHWDRFIKETNSALEKNADENDLRQSLVRLEIYRLVAEVADNVREIQMPIVGTNWQWVPELYYSQGDYDSERMHVYRMLLTAADECMRSYDTEGAQKHLLIALRYLLPGNERESNRADLQAAIIRNMKLFQDAKTIPEAIFAYELTNLSDALRADTATHLEQIEAQRPILRQHVADLYQAKADEYLQQGDSARAADFRALAEDWLLPVESDPDR